MTVQKALDIFKKQYPNKKPIGFWNDKGSAIINTEPEHERGFMEICQFEVTPDGKVIPTNPMQHEVIVNSPMKPL